MELQLENIMAKTNVSPAALARKSGLSRSYIGDLMAGKKSPTIRTVVKLSTALEVSPWRLLGYGRKVVNE
jgi:transcriptional regulator with XRE-family HTH domain